MIDPCTHRVSLWLIRQLSPAIQSWVVLVDSRLGTSLTADYALLLSPRDHRWGMTFFIFSAALGLRPGGGGAPRALPSASAFGGGVESPQPPVRSTKNESTNTRRTTRPGRMEVSLVGADSDDIRAPALKASSSKPRKWSSDLSSEETISRRIRLRREIEWRVAT